MFDPYCNQPIPSEPSGFARICRAATSAERFSGAELHALVAGLVEGGRATLAWQATPELELSISLSAFDPGRFIDETGSGSTIGLLGLESNFRF